MDAFADVEDTGLDDDGREAFRRDVVEGLSADTKTLPCKWLYDVRGSALFEEITHLDEYYPTRTELALLADIADDLGSALPARAWVVEFGSGSSRKSDLFLNALDTPHGYVPIDVAGDYLEAAAGALAVSKAVAALKAQALGVKCIQEYHQRLPVRTPKRQPPANEISATGKAVPTHRPTNERANETRNLNQ